MSAREQSLPARPRVLAVGGLEPTGQAGLWADGQAIEQAGGKGCLVAASLTAQGRRPRAETTSSRMLQAQVESVFDLGRVAAVKTGMLPSKESLKVLLRHVPEGLPWVVDPVIRSSRGMRLSGLVPKDFLALARTEVVLTPNAPEAEWLLGLPPGTLRTVHDIEEAATQLCAQGFGAVVVKGGHWGRDALDVLCHLGRTRRFRGTRLVGLNGGIRGTGCRFASSLATGLGRGLAPEEAVQLAKRHVRGYLRAWGRRVLRAPS